METPSKADRLSPFIFNRAESFNKGKLRWGSGFLPPSTLPMRKYIAPCTNNKKCKKATVDLLAAMWVVNSTSDAEEKGDHMFLFDSEQAGNGIIKVAKKPISEVF
ncbi:hypothetical protein Godav_026844 [Gossypium davidsonii]|uniref:Uncharacterized protein n=1 Tax=Gossypium davidsonii TaxID=34287 RepID=A0A7J8RU89_GOSDV|nr:hypothetical protein [Gossypium davidsonii]